MNAEDQEHLQPRATGMHAGSGNHLLPMLLACVVVIVGVTVLAGRFSGGPGILLWLLLLLCPLMPLFMHRRPHG